MSLLKGIIKETANPYATIAKDGIIGGDIDYFFDSGNYVLNALISGDMLNGGFPSGKVVALAGEKGSGKTFVLTKAIKKFLDADLEREVVLFESEGAVTQKMLIERGIDMDRIAIFPIATVEDLRHQSLKALKYIDGKQQEKIKKDKDAGYAKVLFALDSLGMLGTEWETNMVDSGDSKADMGKRAGLIKSVFRMITLKLGILQIPMIITNHTYSSMNNSGKKMGGGTGLEFAASIIIFLSKSKDKVEGKEKIKSQVGNIVYFTVEKGRFTIEGSNAPIPLSFKEGITQWSGILPLLVSAGLVEKKGAWYKDMEGKSLGQGEKRFYSKASEYVTDEMMDKLIPYVNERFKYGTYEDEEEIEEEKTPEVIEG